MTTARCAYEHEPVTLEFAGEFGPPNERFKRWHCPTCGTSYPDSQLSRLLEADGERIEPNIIGGYVETFIGFYPDEVLPTVCNCTEEGLPYCGRPECDVDWCYACGDEYSEPCARHAEVGRP